MTQEHSIDRARLQAAVVELLHAVGENPEREGLQQTPRRVADMYLELFEGMHRDPSLHIESAIFNEPEAGGLVTVADIPFDSMCEHHLLPFRGTVDISYLPRDGRVVGLSKLARVVETVARRPQVQERLTRQILDALEHSTLNPAGVAVSVQAEHMCMSIRGVRKHGAVTRTAARSGALAEAGDVHY